MTKEKDKSKSKKDEKEDEKSKKEKKSDKGKRSDSSDDKKKKRKWSRSSSSGSSSSSSKKSKKEKKKKSDKAEKAAKMSKVEKQVEKAETDSEPEEVGPDEFMVKLDMSSKKGLGIEVDWANGKSMLVKSVKPEGAVPDWNKDHPPSHTVMAEDHVIAVNGKSGDPKVMLNECRTSKKLKLLVWAHCVRSTESQPSPQKRAFDPRKLADAEAQLQESLAKVQQRRMGLPEQTQILVTVDMRRHTILGLDVDWSNSKLLYIKGLQPGAVEEWNRANPPDRTVQPGDTVVAVNGYAGDARGMAGLCKELCSAQSQLQLRVRGPPPPPSGAPPKLQIAS